MFNGFQQTGQPRATFSTSNMFSGFPERPFSANILPIVTDGIQAWWTSQSGITLSGSNVTSWIDLLAGYNLQPTGGSPTYITADPLYRGYPSINFTSAQNLLAGNILNLGTNAGNTFVAVVNLTSASNAFLSKAITLGDNTAGTWSLQYFSGYRFTLGQGASYVRASISFTVPATIVITIVTDRTAGLSWAYANNLAVSAAISTSLTNFTSTAPFGINAFSGVAGALTMMELLSYNQALTPTQIYQNVAFLRAKYGI